MDTESKAVKQSFDLREETIENQTSILSCLRMYNSIHVQLTDFQTLLFQNATNLPRQIFKHFRKVRELIETSSDTLQTYISFNPNFLDEKDKIIQKQITVMQEQLSKSKKNKLNDSDWFKSKSGTKTTFQQLKRTLQNSEPRQIEFLRQENQALKNKLRKNDSEYEIQIKKYNFKYRQLQDQIQYYKHELHQMGDLLENIEKLQIQVRILKEIKERDEQLIQNMARKLRNTEHQKKRNIGFVSPTKQNYLSPSRVSFKLSPKYNTSSRFE